MRLEKTELKEYLVLGSEFVFLSLMVMLEPQQVDSSLLMRYTDSRMQVGQQLEAFALRQLTEEQKKYGGYVAAPLAILVNRQVSFRLEF